jgi:SpoVK/Ycf46/Vps4 family AAA+-type ATPase
LVALSKKLNLAPAVDLEGIASDTAGYSGADLQAVMYNAHLEVVHASIDASTVDQNDGGAVVIGNGKGKGKAKGKGKEGVSEPVDKGQRWRQVAPTEEAKGTEAEKMALSSRVSSIAVHRSPSIPTDNM